MDKLRRLPNFITVEGIDGVGKSTAVSVIESHLNCLNRNTKVVRQNRDTNLGKLVRSFIGDNENIVVSDTTFALLHSASIHDVIDQIIEPAHLCGKVVISDRYTLSTRVYQAGSKHVDRVCDIIESTLSPDIIFLLDAPPSIVNARIVSRQEDTDIMENVPVSLLNDRRKEFMRLSRIRSNRVHVIDASGDPSDVAEQIISILDNYYR